MNKPNPVVCKFDLDSVKEILFSFAFFSVGLILIVAVFNIGIAYSLPPWFVWAIMMFIAYVFSIKNESFITHEDKLIKGILIIFHFIISIGFMLLYVSFFYIPQLPQIARDFELDTYLISVFLIMRIIYCLKKLTKVKPNEQTIKRKKNRKRSR